MHALAPGWRLLLACAAGTLPLAACDSRRSEPERSAKVGIVTVAAPRPRTSKPIASPTAAATPVPHPPAEMRPRKAFTDPPLPPELLDDGELRPLPPRPGP